MTTFIHLRTHCSYSLSEGAIGIKDVVKLAAKNKMPALGLTDSGNLFGSLEFSVAASEAGVQPIIGVVLTLVEKEPVTEKERFSKIVLFAKNPEGYKNLLALVSDSFLESRSQTTSALMMKDLEGRSGGLIALTGGSDGPIAKALLNNQNSVARNLLDQLRVLFPEHLYIELQRHGLPEEKQIEPTLIDFAFAYDLPLVATNDVYFANRAMFEAHDALICVADGRYISEQNRRRFTPEHYFKTSEEMAALFADIPEAILNTVVIAKRCGVMSETRKPMLPHFETSEGRSEADELRAIATKGLEKRLSETTTTIDRKTYFDRLDFEIDVISRMGFSGYFLIVSDFIRWAKSEGIPVGPGRGSGAGSVVAWTMEITDLDPLRFGLLFERFLNPERVSMPDFDVDFCQDRRDEVIRYVQKKYGRDKVAQIITFGKLQARAVLRDVGRVLQMPYSQVDRICKMIPFNPQAPVTLSEAIEMDPGLQKERDSDASVAKLLSIGLQLEGLYRHASTHAAGLVIGDRPLVELIPLYYDPRSDIPVTQYAMKPAEMAGLVKFDFLGLKTLTLIDNACKLIRATGKTIDIDRLPFDDKPTFAMLAKGDTTGVFQMESAGMRDALRKMRPDTMEDIIALISLYRPGPMENIPTYIARKHGREKPDYLHPKLEGILKETFGVIIYQEQVMQIAQVLSGYTLGGADLLRRAMGKKIKAEMDAQEALFVDGAKNNGVDGAQAKTIFELVAKFAGYGFNKSHAAAYAVIGYQTAYLKANYPVEFYTASMNIDIQDTDKINVYRQEAAKAEIKLLPPDINSSSAYFAPEITENTRAIRYALGALKNVGVAAMTLLEQERKAGGVFKDIFDFAERADSRVLGKRQIEMLSKAGAFDSIHTNRRQIHDAATFLSRFNLRAQEEKASAQVSLFGGFEETKVTMRPSLPEISDWSAEEKMSHAFDALGFYLTSHPLDVYAEELARIGIATTATIEEKISGSSGEVRLAGVVTKITHRATGGKRFAYIQLSDPSGTQEISIFDERLIAESRDLLEGKAPLLVHTDARKDEGGIRLIASRVRLLDQFLEDAHVDIKLELDHHFALKELEQLLKSAGRGRSKVHLFLTTSNRMRVEIVLPSHYALKPPLLEQIKRVAGLRVFSA